MPPAYEEDEAALSDASDDLDEVPAKKPQPRKSAAKPAAKTKPEPKQVEEDEPMEEAENTNGAENNEDEEDDEHDDEEGEEYVVEAILSHDFEKDGTCKYEVKWLGYEAKADRTWEPEENLEGASEVLKAYFEKVGGRPEYKPKTPAAKGRGKRKSAPETTPDVATSAKRGRRSKASATKDDEAPSAFKLPEGSWEDHVQSVESIEQKDGESGLHVYLEWNNGNKSCHPTAVIRRKCPQKLITFYESKLVFKPANEDTEAA